MTTYHFLSWVVSSREFIIQLSLIWWKINKINILFSIGFFKIEIINKSMNSELDWEKSYCFETLSSSDSAFIIESLAYMSIFPNQYITLMWFQ